MKDEQFELFYYTLLGEMEPGHAMDGVENAFAPGSVCDRAYSEMRAAYGRLCLRLGAPDADPDLDAMVDALERIQKDLCKRTFCRKA